MRKSEATRRIFLDKERSVKNLAPAELGPPLFGKTLGSVVEGRLDAFPGVAGQLH
jgi:hypothetical protein